MRACRRECIQKGQLHVIFGLWEVDFAVCGTVILIKRKALVKNGRLWFRELRL